MNALDTLRVDELLANLDRWHDIRREDAAWSSPLSEVSANRVGEEIDKIQEALTKRGAHTRSKHE